MAQESTQAFLQRIALEHCDRKLRTYIQSLELVAQKARVVIGNSQGNGEIQDLKEALENLEKVAS